MCNLVGEGKGAERENEVEEMNVREEEEGDIDESGEIL